MDIEWPEKWKGITQQETAMRILEVLADPQYKPTTTSDLAVNTLEMAGPAYAVYTKARDELVDRGFIIYVWGEPVSLSNAFMSFVGEFGGHWPDVLSGRISPAQGAKPPAVVTLQPITTPPFPVTDEDDQFWQRFHDQVHPMLQSIYSASGEVLYIKTAKQGSRATGGRFSRPDLTYLVVGRYPLSGEKYLHLISVECKLWSTADDFSSAYEAVAYQRFSTAVYYAYETPNEATKISSEIAEVLKENAIGVIRIWRQGNLDVMRIDSEPEYVAPSLARLEAHLENLKEIDESGITKLLHSKYR